MIEVFDARSRPVVVFVPELVVTPQLGLNATKSCRSHAWVKCRLWQGLLGQLCI